MKLLWTGDDALFMHDLTMRCNRWKIIFFTVIRLIVRFLDRFFIEGHIVNNDLLKRDLEKFGVKRSIEVWVYPIKHTIKYKKKEHDTFNILYYKPYRKNERYRDMIYGIDLVEKLKAYFKNYPWIKFIECSRGYGSDKDMSEIYPITDFYIRPNRHDGNSRMIRECEIQKIPYYWSRENPDFITMLTKVKYAIRKSRKV